MVAIQFSKREDNQMEARNATVISVKKSEVRPGIYYVTVNDGFGEIKVVGTKAYSPGQVIKIRRKNPVDWQWLIVKESKIISK